VVEDCECSGHSSTGCTDENVHKVHKRVSGLPKYHFEDLWQVRLVWNMSLNSKGGLKHGRSP